jgi:hypothetical protein
MYLEVVFFLYIVSQCCFLFSFQFLFNIFLSSFGLGLAGCFVFGFLGITKKSGIWSISLGKAYDKIVMKMG